MEELVAAEVAVDEGCICSLAGVLSVGDYLALCGVFVVDLGDELVGLDIADGLVAQFVGLADEVGKLSVEGHLRLDGCHGVEHAGVNILQIPGGEAVELIVVIGHDIAFLTAAGGVALRVVGDVAVCVGYNPLERADGGDGLLDGGVGTEVNLLASLCIGGCLDIHIVGVGLDGEVAIGQRHNMEQLCGVVGIEGAPGELAVGDAHSLLFALLDEELGVCTHDVVVAIDEGIERSVEVCAQCLEVFECLGILFLRVVGLEHHHGCDKGRLKGLHLVGGIGAGRGACLVGYAAFADEIDIHLELSVGGGMLKVALAHHHGCAPCGGIVGLEGIGHHHGDCGSERAIVHCRGLGGIEEHGLQHRGVAEHIDAKACKCGGQCDLIELRAVLKHRVADVGDALGNLDGLQLGAASKRPLTELAALLRHDDGVEVFAVLEGCYSEEIDRSSLKLHGLKVVIVAETAVRHCGDVVVGTVNLNVLRYYHVTRVGALNNGCGAIA